MGNKRYWKNAYVYERILEILDGYWLTQPDELVVDVQLRFTKSNGETQSKHLRWINPDYKPIDAGFEFKGPWSYFSETAEDRERELDKAMDAKNYRRVK